MKAVLTTRIDGVFGGFRPGEEFRLTNGQVWSQVGPADAYAFGEDPAATLMVDRGRFFLRVEGAPGAVEVELAKCRRRSWRCATA